MVLCIPVRRKPPRRRLYGGRRDVPRASADAPALAPGALSPARGAGARAARRASSPQAG